MNTYIRLLVIFIAPMLPSNFITAAEKDGVVFFHHQTHAAHDIAPVVSACATADVSAPALTPAPLVRTQALFLPEASSLAVPPLLPPTAKAPASPALTSSTPDEKPDHNLVATLPFSPLPDIQRHPEQINGLSWVQRAQDTAEFYSISHENYLKKHVEAQTLAVVLATADAQRAKFGHAANELIQKAALRKPKNTIVRMGTLIKWAEAHGIAINEADLTMMKQQTILQLQDALATLALINGKIPTPDNPTPFDKVGKKEDEKKA